MYNVKPTQEGSNRKRNLPSWMSPRDNETKSSGKKPTSSGEHEETKQHNSPSKETVGGRKSKGPDSSSTNFSKLMDGVVFVSSGFVNPERATLRSQALEMGAEYRPDWSPECTLLVCAYSNTPKFRQVEADNGTIVKKEWILECYSQKKLVEIDSYLMHAGKPWRANINNITGGCDQKPCSPRKSEKQVQRGSHSKSSGFSSSKTRASNPAKGHFSPSQVKEWATDDLSRTISWLESQEEKPEPTEIKQIAAGGIIICLQDAVDSLEQDQDVRKIVEQWNIVPHAVEELIKLVDAGNSAACLSKEDLCKQAKAFKQIYEAELSNVNDDSKLKTKRLKNDENESGGNGRSNGADYDSDETVEMTEEEIDLAYNNVASKLGK
ncbi:DNA-repair protein xrcc1, putative [Ricinus communis]|uniref:DNA-repair protein xrcc1, putative n=1 Tax=Ricinus communis TaxID=3988 RepID=B9RUV1_RICCO|nr:DNA-repair protein xrcc1, putative [Ricinus communis]|eukprot:XP_002517520.1 DNA-repair protein XRCC1 isoform X1 [Ricinus communis]